jgi:hypothetical protein
MLKNKKSYKKNKVKKIKRSTNKSNKTRKINNNNKNNKNKKTNKNLNKSNKNDKKKSLKQIKNDLENMCKKYCNSNEYECLYKDPYNGKTLCVLDLENGTYKKIDKFYKELDKKYGSKSYNKNGEINLDYIQNLN